MPKSSLTTDPNFLMILSEYYHHLPIHLLQKNARFAGSATIILTFGEERSELAGPAGSKELSWTNTYYTRIIMYKLQGLSKQTHLFDKLTKYIIQSRIKNITVLSSVSVFYVGNVSA